MIDGSEASAAALVGEMDRRIQGESELHDFRNDGFRAALHPLYPVFDPQDSDEAHLRRRKIPEGEPLEAAREAGLPDFPTE